MEIFFPSALMYRKSGSVSSWQISSNTKETTPEGKKR